MGARWACGKYDQKGTLYPSSDPAALLEVEEMIGLVEDFERAFQPCLYLAMRPSMYGYPDDWPAEEKAATVKRMREQFMAEKLPVFMGFFTEQIGKSNAFLCGPEVTLADLYFLVRLRYFTAGIADHVPKDCLDKYPAITAYLDRLYAVPQIKEWYKK